METNFFGFNTEEELIKHASNSAYIIKNMKSRIIRGSNKGCVGGFDGVFYYDDGTKDNGIDIMICESIYKGCKYDWKK